MNELLEQGKTGTCHDIKPGPFAYKVQSDVGDGIVFASSFAEAVVKFKKHYDIAEDEINCVHLLDDDAIV